MADCLTDIQENAQDGGWLLCVTHAGKKLSKSETNSVS